jgi:hypothetical protein
MSPNVKTLLPVAILLLSGCGVNESSSGTGTLPAVTNQSGGGGPTTGGLSGSGQPTGYPTPPAGATEDPTGIWDFKDTLNGNALTETAIIGSGKYYSTATADQFGCADLSAGTYMLNGNSFTGGGVMQLAGTCTDPAGQGYLPYSLVEGYLLNTSLNLIFDAGGMLVPTLSATMDPLYANPSSLTTLVGNWNDGGNTLTVATDGTFTETQTASGCVVTGAFTLIDATKNLYGVSFEIGGCTTSNANAGIPFAGLGYVDNTNPNTLNFVMEVSGPNPANSDQPIILYDVIVQM